ncbi:MAG TPA: hypothetical protein VJ818_00240, partial [Actinomycetota bacterium]|nr:hypothetical protein [Actinomycetota bacterium]
IAYMTFRRDPRFEWFAASLWREMRAHEVEPEQLQIVVIDGRLWYDPARRIALREIVHGRFEFEHHPPKPTVWQGPNRLTSHDYFAASNARNTAFAYARAPHVAFVDDLSVLLPGWLGAHFRAYEGRFVLCGSTCKNKNINVNGNGDVVSFERFEPGQDSRLATFNQSSGLFRANGGWLFGGTFSVPLEAALKVNGQDELCDTIGGEDYDFGFRLERSGADIYGDRTCGTFEDEDGHHAEAPMIRLDKPWPGEHGPYSSNYLLHRLRNEQSRYLPLGNNFDLRALRDRVLAGEDFPIPTEPTNHWVDGEPLRRM